MLAKQDFLLKGMNTVFVLKKRLDMLYFPFKTKQETTKRPGKGDLKMNPALDLGLLCLLCEVTIKLQGMLAKPGRPHTLDKFVTRWGSYCYTLARKY